MILHFLSIALAAHLPFILLAKKQALLLRFYKTLVFNEVATAIFFSILLSWIVKKTKFRWTVFGFGVIYFLYLLIDFTYLSLIGTHLDFELLLNFSTEDVGFVGNMIPAVLKNPSVIIALILGIYCLKRLFTYTRELTFESLPGAIKTIFLLVIMSVSQWYGNVATGNNIDPLEISRNGFQASIWTLRHPLSKFMRFKKTTVLTDAQINREKNALYLGQKKESLNQFDRQYPYYSQSTLNPHLDRTHHKNVIIILLESFGAGHVKGLSPLYKDVATNMAEWGKKEILFTNGFTNHSPTGPAQFQMMCPLYDGGYSIRHHEDLKILCGPEVLKQNGFETMLFMGHHLKFDNVYNFWRRHGIQKFVGEDEFPLEKLAHLPEGHFGSFTDEQLYRAALDYLEKRNNDESKKSKPFLTFILGVSSHAPFPDFGERYRNQEGTPVIQRLHGAMNYSDAALNQFLIEASKQPWFNDTLIIAVGDHPPPLPPGESVAEQTGNESYRVRVPILAVNLTKDDALKAKLKNKLMGQVDIMPTVLDWLGITTQWGSTGVSMLDETVNEDERQVYAYDSYSNTYHLINTKGYLTKDYRHGQTWGNLADDESSRLLETLKDVNQWVYDNDRIMK